MPYSKIEDLPESVKVLPKEAQEQFLSVVNAALEQYEGDEEKAFQTAWASIKQKWTKEDDKWVKKESFSWVGDIGDIQKTGEYKYYIRGKAIHPIKTVHPEEWPSVRVYLEEELQKSAETLIGAPLLLDHLYPLDGKVTGTKYEDGAIEYIAGHNEDSIYSKTKDGKIEHCSVEYEWQSLDRVNGIAPRGLNFTGLALLEQFEPGDPASTVEMWEAIIKQLKEAKEQGLSIEDLKTQIQQKYEQREQLYAQADALYAEIEALEAALEAAIRAQIQAPTIPTDVVAAIGEARALIKKFKEYAKHLKEQEEPPKAGEPKSDKQRFMDHYGLTEEQMNQVLEWIGEDVYKLLPERGQKVQATEKEKQMETIQNQLTVAIDQKKALEADLKESKAKIKTLEEKLSKKPAGEAVVDPSGEFIPKDAVLREYIRKDEVTRELKATVFERVPQSLGYGAYEQNRRVKALIKRLEGTD